MPILAGIFTNHPWQHRRQEKPYPRTLSGRFYEVQKCLILTVNIIVQAGSIIFSAQPSGSNRRSSNKFWWR